MDFIKKKIKKLRRRWLVKNSTLRPEDDNVLSLHRVRISKGDVYQQSKTSQKSIKRLMITEYKDRKSQDLNNVVLEIMGKDNSSGTIFGRPIHNELAVCFENLATSGLSNEQRKELLNAYLPPVNCKLIAAPDLNPEIKKALSDVERKQDKAICNKQKQISSALSCLGEAITLLMTKDTKDPTVRRLITDTARLLCDAQYNDSITRRNNVLSLMKGDVKKKFAGTKINGMLFGTEVSESSHTIKREESNDDSQYVSKVEIATVNRRGSTSRRGSLDRNAKPLEQNISNLYDLNVAHKNISNHQNKVSESQDHRKIQAADNHKKAHNQNRKKLNDPHETKKNKSSSYRTIQKPIKGFLLVPLDKDTLESPRSSKQINTRDSHQRARSPTQSRASSRLSRASTSSSPRRR